MRQEYATLRQRGKPNNGTCATIIRQQMARLHDIHGNEKDVHESSRKIQMNKVKKKNGTWSTAEIALVNKKKTRRATLIQPYYFLGTGTGYFKQDRKTRWISSNV